MTSGVEHRSKYVAARDLEKQLAEIGVVLEAIRRLSIEAALKKTILNQALWEVTFAGGNTQKCFLGRYRSASVIRQAGLKIQRDHVYRRSTLLRELLGPAPDLGRIIDRALCCVVVTSDEHKSLGHYVDGGRKYKAAGVVVYDMADATRIDPTILWPD